MTEKNRRRRAQSKKKVLEAKKAFKDLMSNSIFERYNCCFRNAGKVTHIERASYPAEGCECLPWEEGFCEGGTKYLIRLAVHRAYSNDDPDYRSADFINITAYGTAKEDPWSSLKLGDRCVIEGVDVGTVLTECDLGGEVVSGWGAPMAHVGLRLVRELD